jgi:ABC-type glutathione transport system ATPase component
MELLKQRQRSEGLSMVFISHDLALVSTFADDLIVLHEGESVETGTCADVLNNPAHDYTKSLIGAWKQAGSGRLGGVAVAPA